MAEARSAVSYQAARPHLSFVVTNEEVVLRVNKVRPSSGGTRAGARLAAKG